MKKISRKAKMIIAAIINVIIISALITMLIYNAEALVPTILLVSLTHISVCGSLLYFIYVAPAKNKKPNDDFEVIF